MTSVKNVLVWYSGILVKISYIGIQVISITVILCNLECIMSFIIELQAYFMSTTETNHVLLKERVLWDRWVVAHIRKK